MLRSNAVVTHILRLKKKFNLTTFRNTEEIILKELSYYKWGDSWYCTKCGHNMHIGGKQPYSRRCKKCKYDESVLKHTAFEGLRFPIATAYKLLSKIISTAVVNPERKLILTGKHQPESDKQQKYISIIDYILRCQQQGMDPFELDDRIRKIIDRQRPSVRQLSRSYNIEENTVTKFLEKIDARISENEICEFDNSHERFISFINKQYDKDIDFYLSLLTVPLVGNWKSGECRIHSRQYALTFDGRSPWAVYEVQFQSDEHGDYKYPFELKERIEYGTEVWQNIFCSHLE